MRLWNESVGLVGGVGRDFPPLAVDWLETAGIDCQGVRRGDNLSARAWQVVESTGIRTQVWRVDAAVRREQLERKFSVLPGNYRQAKGDHFGVHPLSPDYAFIESLRKLDSVISIESFCPAVQPPDETALKQLLQSADIFSLNEHEAVSLVGSGNPRTLISRLIAAGGKVICLRLGEKGSLVADVKTGKAFHIPAIPVPVVDAVGAGNAFCGGFLVGWCETHELKIAGMYGAVAASFMIEQIGPPSFGPEIFSESIKRLETLRLQVVTVAI
jgi:sugar/nucleoside kinase (ribokinase family)